MRWEADEMRHTKPRNRLIPLAAAGAFVMALAGPAGAQESKDPIKLTIHDWTGPYVTTHIMAGVLESMGYNVELVQSWIVNMVGKRSRHEDMESKGVVVRHRSE